MKRIGLLLSLALVYATSLSATSFVVPSDEELVGKSKAIVIGTVEGSSVRAVADAIDTVYEVRVERGLKGSFRSGELLRVASPGGILPDRGVIVEGAAHFASGDRVLLFLQQTARGWEVTDMTLGKFRFVTSDRGERLLLRDTEEIFGWDRAGRPHQEPVRAEEGFLRFINERVAGRRVATSDDYTVASPSATFETSSQIEPEQQTNAGFSPRTYTDNVSDGVTHRGIRWSNISAGVAFHKRSGQNISGVADGGVAAIQSALAAWNNDCGSVINLTYAGETTTASANFDTTHVVEFNDPQGRVSGSWGGSGTIAVAFMSFAGTHNALSDTWWTITDADVVFQDGFPGTHAAFGTALTHEIGHGIGWRHSNQHYIGGGACDSNVQECTSTAIMNSLANSSFGYNLQQWDINAARAVYPGSCEVCNAPAVTGHPQSANISSGATTTLTVTASGTGPLSYQWYLGNSGDTSTPLNGATSSSLQTSPNSTTNYWVRVTNACGTANSNTATVTVASPCSAPSILSQPESDAIYPGQTKNLSVSASGSATLTYQWYLGNSGDTSTPLNGATNNTLSTSPSTTTKYWVRVSNSCGSVNSTTATVTVRGSGIKGDLNADGSPDILWRNIATSVNFVWFMNGTSYSSGAILSPSVSDVNWRIVGAADFNGDRHTDIVWRNITSGSNLIWLMDKTNYQSLVSLPSTSDQNWRISAIADLNDDGSNDIVWRNSATSSNIVWLMNGTSYSTYTQLLPAVSDPNWVLEGAGDFNADGDPDLVWRNYATGRNFIWYMNGLTYITGLEMPVEADSQWRIDAVADYSGDGIADLVWRHVGSGANRMWVMGLNATVSSTVALPSTADTNWEIGGPK